VDYVEKRAETELCHVLSSIRYWILTIYVEGEVAVIQLEVWRREGVSIEILTQV
jgi:hypothetical protein